MQVWYRDSSGSLSVAYALLPSGSIEYDPIDPEIGIGNYPGNFIFERKYNGAP